MGRRNRASPSDPQAILLKRAKERQEERLRARSPAEWGVSAEILTLPTAYDVTAVVGPRERILHARRSDAFTLLHQAKRYGLDGALESGISDGQHRASQRYVADWCERAGVRTAEPTLAPTDVQTDGQGATQRMIDAGRRIDAVHARVGRASARLLRALVEPMVMGGEIRVWRELARGVTGETERHAQAASVRMACENLRLAYEEIDGATPMADTETVHVPIRVWRSE